LEICLRLKEAPSGADLEAEALHVRWQDIRNEVLAQLDLIAHELDLLGGIVVQQHPNGRPNVHIGSLHGEAQQDLEDP